MARAAQLRYESKILQSKFRLLLYMASDFRCRSMKGRAPYLAVVERKLSTNHINVDALIQKGACNEARQVYGDGCSPSNDSGGGDRCGRPDRAGNDSGDRSRTDPSVDREYKRTRAYNVGGVDASRVAL